MNTQSSPTARRLKVPTMSAAEQAADVWGFNCGPGALCAVTERTPDEIRPYLGDFERRGYMNPTMMRATLRQLGIRWREALVDQLPSFGLVRVQFDGPWMRPGVPIVARYQHTHWVAARAVPGPFHLVFDINAIHLGGWMPETEWREELIPWLLSASVRLKRATGIHSYTHCWELPLPEGL